MTLEERITADMKAAMKSKDKVALRAIRAVKAAILLAKTDGTGADFTPEKEIALVQKMIKQRKDSFTIYTDQGRDDLAQVEQEEIDVISNYLPEQLSSEKLKEVIQGIIEESGAEGMKDMGRIMGIASKQIAGQADGKTISAMVKELLQG